MNLNKHIDFFNPGDVKDEIHIIGCGALGSHVAHTLTRLGIEKLTLWDYDLVSAHNITNQMYRHSDIGEEKIIALSQQLQDINPNIRIKIRREYKDQNLNGYVFLMVDSIETRKDIVDHIKNNKTVRAVFDARMRLTDAQSYAADWSSPKSVKKLLSTMNFTSEEAKEATPVSACGTTLSITPTVQVVASLTVSNFINFTLGKELKEIILVDTFSFNLNTY